MVLVEGRVILSLDIHIRMFFLQMIGFFSSSAIDTLIKQKSLSERQQRRGRRQYTSRVHVLDICQALKACIQKPSSR